MCVSLHTSQQYASTISSTIWAPHKAPHRWETSFPEASEQWLLLVTEPLSFDWASLGRTHPLPLLWKLWLKRLKFPKTWLMFTSRRSTCACPDTRRERSPPWRDTSNRTRLIRTVCACRFRSRSKLFLGSMAICELSSLWQTGSLNC